MPIRVEIVILDAELLELEMVVHAPLFFISHPPSRAVIDKNATLDRPLLWRRLACVFFPPGLKHRAALLASSIYGQTGFVRVEGRLARGCFYSFRGFKRSAMSKALLLSPT